MTYSKAYFGKSMGFWVDGNQNIEVNEITVVEKEVILPRVEMNGYTIEIMPISMKMSWTDASKTNQEFWFDKSDWRLPFNEELKEIYKIREELGITGGHYWSLDHGCTHVLFPNDSKYKNAFFMDFRSGEIMCQTKYVTRYALFIRRVKE
jgi:hypothetical protein